jgi:hypothetical protein
LSLDRGFGRRGAEQSLYILFQIKGFAGLGDRFFAGLGARLYLVKKVPTFLGLQRHVLSGVAFEQETPSPGRVLVGPSFNRIAIAAGLAWGEAAQPAVVLVVSHEHPVPPSLPIASPQQFDGDYVMAVAKDIGPDLDRFARNPFDRKAAAVDAGINILNQKPAA